MPSSDERRLLDDVLRDANYAAFRAETYELARAEFNRGRQRSIKAGLLAIAAVIAVSTALMLTLLAGKGSGAARENAAGNAANIQPSEHLATVTSTPMEAAGTVRSVMDRSLFVETEGTGNPGLPLVLVHSNPSSVIRIMDAELLALLSNDTLGFLRSGERLSLYYPPDSTTR